MQTVQSTNILSIRTGLTTEALCIRTILNWKIFFIQDNIAINISNRNLSGWDQIQIIHFAMIHLTLFIRQLTCSVT